MRRLVARRLLGNRDALRLHRVDNESRNLVAVKSPRTQPFKAVPVSHAAHVLHHPVQALRYGIGEAAVGFKVIEDFLVPLPREGVLGRTKVIKQLRLYLEPLLPCLDLTAARGRDKLRPFLAVYLRRPAVRGGVDAVKAFLDKPQMVELRESRADICHCADTPLTLGEILGVELEQIGVRLGEVPHRNHALLCAALRLRLDEGTDIGHDFAAGFGDFLVDGLADMELVHDDGGIGQALLHISTIATGHIHRYDLDIGVVADHALNGCNDGILLVVGTHLQQNTVFNVCKDGPHIMDNVLFINAQYAGSDNRAMG